MPRVARYAVNNSVSYQKAQDKKWLATTKIQQALSSQSALIRPLNAGRELSQCNLPQKCVLIGAALAVLVPTTHASKIKVGSNQTNSLHTEVLTSQQPMPLANHTKQVSVLSARPGDFYPQAMLSIDGGRQGVGDVPRSYRDVAAFPTKSKTSPAQRLPRASDRRPQPMTEASALALLNKIGEEVQVGALHLLGLQPKAINKTNETLTGEMQTESGSIAQKVADYIANKAIKSEHPMAQCLLNDYLSYPTKLDLTYRVLGHSPGELPLRREFCLRGPKSFPAEFRESLTRSQQEMFSDFMYRATKTVAQEISLHTQFTLSEAEQGILPDIHVLNKFCGGDLGSGTAERPSSDFSFVLHVPELSDANTTQDTSLGRLANITDTFRIRYAGSATRILLEPSISVMNDSDQAQHLVRHELLHALGLPDMHSQEKSITTQQTVLSYNCVQPLDGYLIDIVSCSGLSQSLMPYDIFALDEIANFVRHEQAQRRGHNPLKRKSPHRGDTLYHFVPGSNVIEVRDQRKHGVTASYVMRPGQPLKAFGLQQASGAKTSHERYLGQSHYVFRTLIDPSGYDSLDFSDYKTNITVDIRPGAASLFNHSALVYGEQPGYRGGPFYVAGNIYLPASPDVAYLIERVFGGDGDDVIHGNTLDNTFHPGKGRDIVTGGGGCDTFVFRSGAKKLTITDFDTQCDRLALKAKFGIKNHEQLMQRSHHKTNGDLEIRLRRHEKIVLKNMGNQHINANNLLVLAQRNRFL